MRPTLIMACSLWVTFALCIVIGVMVMDVMAMGSGYPDPSSLGLLVVAALSLLGGAIQFTRNYRKGIPFPFVKEKLRDLRRASVRERGARSPR